MIASCPSARKFLAVPNGMTPSRHAIFCDEANVEAVEVVSLTTGAAGACSFQLQGDHSLIFTEGTKSRFCDSETREELTTVSSSSYDSGTNLTTVQIREAVAAGEESGFTVRGQACPRILVWNERISVRKQTQTRGDFQFDRGTLCFSMEWEPGEEFYNPGLNIVDVQGALRQFRSLVSGIWCEIQEKAGHGDAGGGLTWTDFTDIALIQGPAEVERQEANEGRPMMAALFECNFGGVS